MRISNRSHLYQSLNAKNFKFNYFDYFITCLTRSGKRIRAYNIFFKFIARLRLRYKFKNFEFFLGTVFDKRRPLVSFLKRKVAAVWFSVPAYIRIDRSRALIVRWFIINAKMRSEYSLVDQLYYEFIDFYENKGRTVKYVERYHKLASDNIPFAKKGLKKKFKIKSFRRRKYNYYF